MSIALVFPGQGSQQLGMLADISQEFAEVSAVFAASSDHLGYDLWQIVAEGPAEKLDQTIYTQPAVLAASYAIWKILSSRIPLNPAYLAGHSLGEYTALVCADAIPFAEGIKLVSARAQYMQKSAPIGSGALAAVIGLTDEKVAELCAAASEGEVLTPANFNSEGQVVIGGTKSAVERACAQAKDFGARLAKILPVSVPSHTPLMQSAAQELEQYLMSVTITKPQNKIINNVDVKVYQDAADIKDGLVRQLSNPVQWTKTIKFIAQQNVTTVIECGPSKVLSGLIKRIESNLQLLATNDVNNLNHVLKVEV